MGENDLSVMIGKTLESVTESGEEMTFVCTDGSAFRAYHMQDCCETVRIHDIAGDLQSLLGSPLLECREEVSRDWPGDVPKESFESFTWTTHIFRTATDFVRVRWLGESNGYYGESVHFGFTHKPIALNEEPT